MNKKPFSLHNTRQKWFTLVEIVTVITIIWVLATSLFIVVGPYMARSRDTKRVTDILGYTNILDAYDKNFDTFPSNYGSGWPLGIGYCLTEMVTLRSDQPSLWNEGKFSSLSKDTSTPPHDPTAQIAVESPLICPMPGSYIYSRLLYGGNHESQIAIVAARLELRVSGNYGTGSDLTNSGKVQDFISAKKSTIPDSAPDQLYTVFKLR